MITSFFFPYFFEFGLWNKKSGRCEVNKLISLYDCVLIGESLGGFIFLGDLSEKQVFRNLVFDMVDPISKRTHCYYKHKHKSNNKNTVEDSFFGPYGITSLATHVTSTYYCFFV